MNSNKQCNTGTAGAGRERPGDISGIFHVFVIGLIITLMLGTFQNVHAKVQKTQQFSKDYKAYAPGTPENVVTKFIEYADLAKDANRQADERFPLFWSLTERMGT